MVIRFRFALTLIFVILVSALSNAQNKWTLAQKEVIQTMNGISETTAPNGKGAYAYGSFLSDDFSRWTIGSTKISAKDNWIQGINEWFKDGWRVSERKQQILEITILL